jgi:hypothetical protein
MTRHYAITTLVLAAMASGCVGKPVPSRPIFYKPGASSAQIEADEARGVVQAIGDAGPSFKPVVSIDREAVYKCMEARGYQVRRPV